MAAPVLPPAKRKKEGPPRLETSPLLPVAAAGWSALPPDLVRHVADSLLATNDLDFYMDFRAVCSGWRAATDDPRSDATDPRFRPRRWIVLDEVFQSQGKMLLLNTDSGRFLHRELPLLNDHHVVATTRNGYLVLADKSPPHAVNVLNPLTRVVIRFVAPVPPKVGSAAVVFFDDSSPTLTLFCDSSHNVYTADLSDIGFDVLEGPGPEAEYDFFRKTVLAGVYADIEPAFHGVLDDLCSLLMSGDVAKFFPGGLPDATDLKWFPVGLGKHMLLVVNAEGSIFVLKKNIQIGKLVALDSISNYAIFMGLQRCLAVDAEKFPGIEANCVYYIENLGSSAHICKCNIKNRKVERISEAADFVKHGKQFVLVADRPLTIIHLLSSYTINIPDSQMALQQIP
ncbi:hypothetical protein CFC21_049809 [Triticum aestivum]|uniref:KIB1-4 beta-propeller domain-containing protein n=5 Tax=Triticinae TaxID=1648030 RepID=A0A453GIH9_AEGTS|nr:uncharacterized protein LOC109762905 [Aegilops tauschii subsp. strangulata]XP_044359392.1 uncharacterized protein LOC123080526 [Triticum aestivum]KAF7039864.1 hypothetical protein CFC21_049809 [Triticum aestivum]